MDNKNYINIRQFENNLKPILSDDIYKNIFIRDDLDSEEIVEALEALDNIFEDSETNHYPKLKKLAALKTYKNICNAMRIYGMSFKLYIYLFANAAYMEIRNGEPTYLTASDYTVVHESLPLWSETATFHGYRLNHTYFVLSNNKIIGVFDEDMNECNVFQNSNFKNFMLPTIKDEKIKDEVQSAIMLLKLGGKV